jgi:hypothetical protein
MSVFFFVFARSSVLFLSFNLQAWSFLVLL